MKHPKGTKLIPLTQGKYAIVDKKNYKWLSQWRWFAAVRKYTYYAARNVTVNNKHRQLFMHQEILRPSKDKYTDHCNQNGYDNREVNLRECTKSQNSQNMRYVKGLSKYKGVSWKKDRSKWKAYIVLKGKQYHLGYYILEIEAACAYDRAAIKYFGEFAYTNFPRKEYEDVAMATNT